MKEEIIKSLFQDKKYYDLKTQLENEAHKKRHSVDVNFYLYFLYSILGKIDERNNQYQILEKRYQKNKGELYCQLAEKCTNIILTRGSYFTYNDVNRFLILAIQYNPNHSLTNILLGENEISKFSERYDLINGLNRINKAVKIDPTLLDKKITILLNLRIMDFNDHFKLVYSKEEINLIINEFKKFPSQYKDTEYYIKLLEIYILARDFKSAHKIIHNVQKVKGNYKQFRIDSLIYKLFFLQKDFDNAIIYASKIGLWDKANCYYDFKKYKMAAECYIEYFDSQELTYRLSAQYKIAESYFKCLKYEKALNYIEDCINNNDVKLSNTKVYLNSLKLKGLINCRKRDFKKAIEIFKQIYNLIKFTEHNDKYNILEEIIFNLASTYAEFHIDVFVENSRKFPIPEKFDSVDDYKRIVDHLDWPWKFNSDLKLNFERFSRELISMNSNREKDIKHLELIIEKKEKEYSSTIKKVIEEISYKALVNFPENEEILFRLALCQSFLNKNYDALKTYKKLIHIDSDNPAYLNNISMIYLKKKQFNKSLQNIKKSIIKSEYNKDSIQIYDNYLSVFYHMIKTIKDRNRIEKLKKEAEHYSDLLIRKVIAENYTYNRDSEGLYEIQNMELFKYKVFNTYILDSIFNGNLYFSKLSQLNDPLDLPLLEWSEFKEFKNFKIKDSDLRIFCASLEDKNTLMWSHYADSHKGICIGYKIISLPRNIGWDKINYVHSNFNYDRIAKDKGAIISGLYTKNINWSYEKEVRLIRYKEENEFVSYSHPILPNDRDNIIDGYISQIIIGYKFPDKQLSILKSLLKELNIIRISNHIPVIDLYRIRLDPKKPFSLMKIPEKY